jgi:hypothetical protein
MSCVMPLHDRKKNEGFSMTPQFPQKVRQAEHRWLSPLFPSILAAVNFILPVASASLAAATECQVTEDGGKLQGMTAWKSTTLNTLLLTLTVERDIYGGLVPSPVLEVAPYMKSNRMVWGNTVNQEIAAIGVCVSQDIRKNARFTQAMITSIGRTQAKAHTKAMKVSALPYNGKRQVHTIRTTLPEIGIAARDKAPTIIGPVQEIEKSILSDERSVGRPFVALNPFQNALQLPDNDSGLMNLTTTLALDNRNCVSGCP